MVGIGAADGGGSMERLRASGAAGQTSGAGSDAGSYTGVVVIHGIGDEKRNDTLREALNALGYWYNHEAGLALRPEGPGRIWMETELTDDPNPDAASSRAIVELAAPGDTSGDVLRLEMREVWWAQSFGVPDVGAALKWARLQYREETRRVLLPAGVRAAGPAHAASRAPALETPQALHYRPAAGGSPAPATGARPDAHQHASAREALLRAALGVYSALQYVWKLLVWTLVTPLLYVLILLIGVVKLLARIPFLQSAVVSSLSALIGYVSLHWVGPLEVYLEDYTRSSAMRQRFERELEAFLADDRCDRIVVVAHSMGTVIAYEGLTTVLNRPDVLAGRKPVTFISLGQALRRMWLLAGMDNHRLRRVMPDHVRWLDIWARYDPIAAGPLTAAALPRLAAWTDPTTPDPHDAICATLARLENIDVVNRDSLLTDHTTYWQNMEQVVGPIALELTRGHPAMERHVQANLASPDRVVWRRWQVAWRATFAMVAALAAAGVFLWTEAARGWPVGEFLRTNAPGFLVAQLQNLLGLSIAPLKPALDGVAKLLAHVVGPGGASPNLLQLLFAALPLGALYSVVVALLGVGMVAAAAGRVVALPSPFKLSYAVRDQSSRGVFRLAQFTLGLAFAVATLSANGGTGIFSGGHLTFPQTPLYRAAVVDGYLALAVAALVTWVWGLVGAARRRHWYWVLANLLLPLATVANVVQVSRYLSRFSVGALLGALLRTNQQINFVAVAVLIVALVGSLIGLGDLVAARRWPLALVFAAGTVLLGCTLLAQGVVALVAFLQPNVHPVPGLSGDVYQLPEPLGTFENIFYNWLFIVAGVASFIGYGLWSGLMGVRTRWIVASSLQRAAFVVAFCGVLLVALAPAVPSVFAPDTGYFSLSCGSGASCGATPAWLTGAIAAAALASVVAFAMAVTDAFRTRQAVWLAVVIAGAAFLLGIFWFTGSTYGVPDALIYPVMFASLVYGLWGGRPTWQVSEGPPKPAAAR